MGYGIVFLLALMSTVALGTPKSKNKPKENSSDNIHMAVKYRYYEKVKEFLESGVSANATDQEGSTPLHIAAEFGSNLFILDLLKGYKADFNARAGLGQTPLHIAAAHNRQLMATLLCIHGADPNAKDHFGRTPLHLAVISGEVVMVRMLRLRGADSLIKDQLGRTALDYAIQLQEDDLIAALQAS